MEQKPAPRIAHIHLGTDGGSERFFLRLVKGLAARGIEQIAFVGPDRPWREALAEHCAVHEIRYRRRFPKRQLRRLRVNLAIRRFHATAALAWMNTAARLLPPPRPGLKTFVRLGDFPLALGTFEYAECIIGNTPEVVHRCVELGWPAERTRMISNFVADDRQPPADRKVLATPEDAFVVVALGRFVPRKGFDTLIEAIAKVDRAYLWLIGEGEELESARDRISRLGIAERVRLPGWQPSGMPFIKAADVLCCPSREEPLANVVLEAWAAGRAVVATASEGPTWLIDDERTGLLVPIGDVDRLAEAIARLRDDKALRARLAQAGNSELQARFSEEAICSEYLDCLTRR